MCACRMGKPTVHGVAAEEVKQEAATYHTVIAQNIDRSWRRYALLGELHGRQELFLQQDPR